MEPVREMLSASQISEQKWRVLRVVNESGPLEQSVIANHACLLLPSLTRLIQSLETEGLVTKTPGITDRRKSIIEITQKGRDLIHQHAAQSNAIFAELEAQFGSEKLTELLDLLEDLHKVRL